MKKKILLVLFILLFVVSVYAVTEVYDDYNMMGNSITNITDVNTSYLNISGCGANQIWKYSTTNNKWECSTDVTNNTDTTVIDTNISSVADTNASTACSVRELLDGDNNCITFSSLNITWSNSTFNSSYEWFLNSTIFRKYNQTYHDFVTANLSAKTDYIANTTERVLFLNTTNVSYEWFLNSTIFNTIADTNASTGCSNAQVLLGNGTCADMSTTFLNMSGDTVTGEVYFTDAGINITDGNISIGNGTDFGGICWNGTGIIITGNFTKYCR